MFKVAIGYTKEKTLFLDFEHSTSEEAAYLTAVEFLGPERADEIKDCWCNSLEELQDYLYEVDIPLLFIEV